MITFLTILWHSIWIMGGICLTGIGIDNMLRPKTKNRAGWFLMAVAGILTIIIEFKGLLNIF